MALRRLTLLVLVAAAAQAHIDFGSEWESPPVPAFDSTAAPLPHRPREHAPGQRTPFAKKATATADDDGARAKESVERTTADYLLQDVAAAVYAWAAIIVCWARDKAARIAAALPEGGLASVSLDLQWHTHPIFSKCVHDSRSLLAALCFLAAGALYVCGSRANPNTRQDASQGEQHEAEVARSGALPRATVPALGKGQPYSRAARLTRSNTAPPHTSATCLRAPGVNPWVTATEATNLPDPRDLFRLKNARSSPRSAEEHPKVSAPQGSPALEEQDATQPYNAPKVAAGGSASVPVLATDAAVNTTTPTGSGASMLACTRGPVRAAWPEPGADGRRGGGGMICEAGSTSSMSSTSSSPAASSSPPPDFTASDASSLSADERPSSRPQRRRPRPDRCARSLSHLKPQTSLH